MFTRRTYVPRRVPNLFFDGGNGFSNFMNSGYGQGIANGISSLNQMQEDYKASNGNQYLDANLKTMKWGNDPKGQIASGVVTAANGIADIMDLVDKMSHKKDRRSLSQIAGLYCGGGRLFDAGGTMDKISTGVQTAGSLLANAQAQASIRDTGQLHQDIANNYVGGYNSNMSFDDVSNQFNNLRVMSHVTPKDLRPNSWGSDFVNSFKAGLSGSSAGFNIGGGVGAIIGGVAGTASSWIGSLLGRSKAKKEAEKANEHIDYQNAYNDRALMGNVENVGKSQLSSALKSLNAFGGSLNSHGANFDAGFTYIGEGGSHESNPNDGVQVGVDEQGTPNLVEEGEVIWNDKDYVFSKRLKAGGSLLKSFGLPEKLQGKSFAEVAQYIGKESEETPTDPITKRTRDALFERLMNAQEEVRGKKQIKQLKKDLNAMPPDMQQQAIQGMMQPQGETQFTDEQQASAQMMGAPMFAYGGPKGRMLSGEGVDPNLLTVAPVNVSLAQKAYDNPQYFKDANFKITPEQMAANMAMLAEYDKQMGGGAPIGTSVTGDNTLDELVVRSAGKLPTVPITLDYTPKGVFPKAGKLATIPITLDTTPKGLVPKADKTFRKEAAKARRIQRQKTAEALRYASLVPGLYGLANPPEAHSMIPTRSRDVSFTPSGVNMQLDYVDPNYLSNMLIAQGRATDRGIMNSSANRGQALAGLLASGYNLNHALGDAYTKGVMQNNEIAAKMADFYNQRDLANAQGIMQAMAHNQGADAAYDQRAMAAAEYNGNEADKVYATRMANLENLFGNLSNIGEDYMNRADAQYTADAQREAITNRSSKKACGGKLRRKKSRGLTC